MNDYVPAVRFNNYTDSWRKCNLGDCVSYTKGFAFKSGEYRDEGIRIVRVSDLSSNAIKDNNEKKFIDKNRKDKYIKYQLNIGDIIITTVGSKAEMKDSAVGRPIIINKKIEGLLNQNLVKLFPIDKSNSYFIYGNLLKERYTNYIALIERGNANQANIALSDLWKHVVYLTSPEEQEKIGSFFSKLDNIITLQQQLLNDHKQLKKAMLQKMFPQKGESVPELRFDGFKENWKKINLGTLVEISSGINGNVTLNNGKYKLTRIETISNGKVNFNKVGFTNELPEKKYLLNKGDILYSNINSLAHIGKIAKFNLNYELYHGINLLRLSPKRILNSDFLYQYLSTVIAKQWAVAHANQAVNQASINQTELSKQLVHIPEYEEQAQIGNFFKQLDETIELHENKLKTYQELKKAMLQKMFI